MWYGADLYWDNLARLVTSGFFYQTSSPVPLFHTLKGFQCNFFRIAWDKLIQTCVLGVNDAAESKSFSLGNLYLAGAFLWTFLTGFHLHSESSGIFCGFFFPVVCQIKILTRSGKNEKCRRIFLKKLNNKLSLVLVLVNTFLSKKIVFHGPQN